MGTWGVDIFDDDFALDVKGDYEDILDSGLSHELATKTLIDRYQNALEDPEESDVFWLALAAIQLEHEALEEMVKMKALDVISSARDLLRWENSPDLVQRKKVLSQLNDKLQRN